MSETLKRSVDSTKRRMLFVSGIIGAIFVASWAFFGSAQKSKNVTFDFIVDSAVPKAYADHVGGSCAGTVSTVSTVGISFGGATTGSFSSVSSGISTACGSVAGTGGSGTACGGTAGLGGIGCFSLCFGCF